MVELFLLDTSTKRSLNIVPFAWTIFYNMLMQMSVIVFKVENDDKLSFSFVYLIYYIQLVNVCSFNGSLLFLFFLIGFSSLLSPALLPVYHKTPSNPNVPPRTPRLTPRHSAGMILCNRYIETLFL
jgi:hypothetical protein